MSRPIFDSITMQGALCWPSKTKMWLYLKINLTLNLLFVVVYGGANQLASLRDNPYHYFTEWERNIPLVPAMIYVYMSISILFWLPLFVLDAEHLRRLGVAVAICIMIAGLCFVLFPGTTGFVTMPFTQTNDSIESCLFDMLHRLDKPYNTAPSLHVSLSTLIMLATNHSVVSRRLRTALLLWLCIIMLSVVLVHQHHLMDVVTGWILGYGCYLHYRHGIRTIN